MMQFKLELILRRGFDKEFEMQLVDAELPALTIRFSCVSDEKDKRYGNCLCCVLTQITPPPAIEKLLMDVPKPTPKVLLDFTDELEGRLDDVATRILKLLRWYCGSTYGHNPVGVSKGLTYSIDSTKWRHLSRTINFRLTVESHELIMTDKVAAEVAALWQKGEQQPLAHELFREAAGHKHENPRSCLVLAIAAAEVGFKQLVGNLIPNAKWFADNVPSPPLATMLEEYLPQLPTAALLDGVKPKVPSKLLKAIRKAVLLRNQVVHGKAPSLSSETLQETLEAIRDCLYLFDCYNGKRWAWGLISIETQELIVHESCKKLPTSREKTIAPLRKG